MSTERCATCGRDPRKANSEVAECSHPDCPHRRRCWSDREMPRAWRPERAEDRTLGGLFDDPEAR